MRVKLNKEAAQAVVFLDGPGGIEKSPAPFVGWTGRAAAYLLTKSEATFSDGEMSWSQYVLTL